MQSFRRFLAALSSLIVGAASFALSFVALRDVAVSTGAVPAHLGFLVPIVIDGGVICGSAVIWALSKEERDRPIFPFIFVGVLVAISVVVNAAHAGPSVLAKVIAGLPPLILLATLELVASQGRRTAQTEPAASRPTTAARISAFMPEPALALAEEPVARRPATESLPPSVTVPAAASPVAAPDEPFSAPATVEELQPAVVAAPGATRPVTSPRAVRADSTRQGRPGARSLRVRAEEPVEL